MLLYTSKFETKIVYRRIRKKIESNLPDDQFGFGKSKAIIMSSCLIVEKLFRYSIRRYWNIVW